MEDGVKTGTKTVGLEAADAETNKAAGILAYLIFFLPLLMAKNSPFAMYHANQGLVLFLLAVAINIIGSIVPVLGWFLVFPLGNLLLLVLMIMGMINAGKGLKKPLPIVGKYNIL